ncbi:hypothetical protein Taro_001769 [Colocasia esculenta]|uniref:Retrotransposon gag domain-containing protein n=1 Tax=Colocasia esculenta TaxID=4460 RepID=A0A843TFF9_COLES|nr:hypothetical protein [Colocasia esculenta]
MDMNAQERLVAAMEMLCQDIELYAQAQREAHLQIKEEDLLLHQVEGHWAALSDAARELYHGAGVEQQIPLIMDGGDANWRKMESSMLDLTRVMKEKKANEFAGLKQLRMSVSEYEAQFARLSKYAPHLISTEKLKAKRFMNGLPPHFITQLTPHLITTYSEMVKRALALEAANETVDKIRGKSGEGSLDRKRKYESGNAPKIQQAAKKVGKAPLLYLVFSAIIALTWRRWLLLELSLLLGWFLVVGVAALPVDSQPKAVDRRMPCRTQITGTVIQLGMTFKGLSAEWTH